jgi:hypothetical protein
MTVYKVQQWRQDHWMTLWVGKSYSNSVWQLKDVYTAIAGSVALRVQISWIGSKATGVLASHLSEACPF